MTIEAIMAAARRRWTTGTVNTPCMVQALMQGTRPACDSMARAATYGSVVTALTLPAAGHQNDRV